MIIRNNNRHSAYDQRVFPTLVIVMPINNPLYKSIRNMNHKQNIITQYNKTISKLMDTDNYQSYLITTMFNMTTHVPDHVESIILNRIKHFKKTDPYSPVLTELYKQLSDYRFKTNLSLNRKIYEKDITFKRVSFVWEIYEKFQSHLVQSLIKNAGRSGKIELHPLTFDFMDVNGSSHHNHVWDDDGTLHLHSIYLIRNEISEKFDGLVADQFMPIIWHKNLTGIRGAHGERIGSQPNDLSKSIEYASKFMTGFDPMGLKSDLPLNFQYPLSDAERRQRRADAQRLHAA